MFGLGLEPGTARRVAGALWALAAACGVMLWIDPRWLRPLYVGLIAVSFPIGLVTSHVVVGIVYFGVVTPIAVVFRIMGRDSLGRKFDGSATSYWTARPPVVDVARYYRQF
jgi:hypothetical protein